MKRSVDLVSKLERELLSAVFDVLNRSQAVYCVTNNYETLPDSIPSDVDIAIDVTAFNKLDYLIDRIAREYGMEVVQKIWHGYHKCAYILSPTAIDERFRIQLDFFVDFSVRGFPNLISNKTFLKNRMSFKNFFIPSPEVEAPFLFMRRVIKNDLTIRHVEKLRLLLEKEKDRIQRNFVDIFGIALAEVALRVIETGNIIEFQENLQEYRRALKRFSRRNTTTTYTLRYSLSQLKRVLNRLMHPVGFSVVLLGPDGSGKSTIANLVLEKVSGSFHGGGVQYWRPYLLPAMGKLKVWNPYGEITANPHPHDHPKQNPFKSVIRFFYYFLDYLIGYPVKVYWQKVRKKIIIFDRYYYDYLVDLHRYKFNIPSLLPRLLLPLIPKPDMIIYLDAEPEELSRRKEELPLKELQRQVGAFRKVIKGLPRAHIVRTDRPLADVVKEIAYLILSAKAAQTNLVFAKGKQWRRK